MFNANSERRVASRTFTDEEAVLLCDERHHNAKLRNLSCSGARLVTPARPEVGTAIIFFADAFGRFEGKIARHAPFGLGIELVSESDRARHLAERLETYGGRTPPYGCLPQGLDAKRVLLETLALSGSIAGSRTEWSRNFWEVAMECRNSGWIITSPISPEFDMIELTVKGRRALGV